MSDDPLISLPTAASWSIPGSVRKARRAPKLHHVLGHDPYGPMAARSRWSIISLTLMAWSWSLLHRHAARRDDRISSFCLAA